MSNSAQDLSDDDCIETSSLTLKESYSTWFLMETQHWWYLTPLIIRRGTSSSPRPFSVSLLDISIASLTVKLSDGGPASVDLDEDDPRAVELILRVLHHQTPDPSVHLDLSLIASIALHADKQYVVVQHAVNWLPREFEVESYGQG
jgi:hypothetical protein